MAKLAPLPYLTTLNLSKFLCQTNDLCEAPRQKRDIQCYRCRRLSAIRGATPQPSNLLAVAPELGRRRLVGLARHEAWALNAPTRRLRDIELGFFDA